LQCLRQNKALQQGRFINFLIVEKMVKNEIKVTEFKAQLDRIERAAIAQKNVLTFDEACQFSGISKSFMYKLTSQKKIDHFKPRGKQIYIKREALENWLLQNPIKRIDVIEQEAVNYLIGKKGGSK
jgi:excisionase family DNA binding protein